MLLSPHDTIDLLLDADLSAELSQTVDHICRPAREPAGAPPVESADELDFDPAPVPASAPGASLFAERPRVRTESLFALWAETVSD